MAPATPSFTCFSSAATAGPPLAGSAAARATSIHPRAATSWSAALSALESCCSAADQDAAARGWIEVARAAAEPAGGGPAIAALEKQVKDGVAGASVLLGEAQLARGETGAARRAYETAAVEASALQYLALYRLAALALESGKQDEAVRQARAALVLSPGHLPSHSILGRALWASGKADEAAPELQLVQNSGRASAEDEIAFAQALAAAGDASAAKAALIRARQKGADEGLVAKIEESMGAAPAPKAPPPRRRGRR